MRFCIDIDGVIGRKCKWTVGEVYLRKRKTFMNIKPNKKAIAIINKLFLKHTIILHTSRIWHDYEATRDWLYEHNVRYDTLIMAKPLADVYIDDKNISLEDFYAL